MKSTTIKIRSKYYRVSDVIICIWYCVQQHIDVEFQFSWLSLAIIEFFVVIIGTFAFSASWEIGFKEIGFKNHFKWSVQRALVYTMESIFSLKCLLNNILGSDTCSWKFKLEISWSWKVLNWKNRSEIGKNENGSSTRNCRSTTEYETLMKLESFNLTWKM